MIEEIDQREQYYQAKLALALKLSEGTIFENAIQLQCDAYNKNDDTRTKERIIAAINAMMTRITGSRHWSCYKCGINQHGVWVK